MCTVVNCMTRKVQYVFDAWYKNSDDGLDDDVDEEADEEWEGD